MPRKRLFLTVGVLAALLVAALLVYISTHRQQILVVTADTLVLRDFPTGPDANAAPNPVVAVIAPGPRHLVLSIRDGEAFQAVSIRLTGNVTGWVIIGPTAHLERSR
jgi:hypothetical protein